MPVGTVDMRIRTPPRRTSMGGGRRLPPPAPPPSQTVPPTQTIPPPTQTTVPPPDIPTWPGGPTPTGLNRPSGTSDYPLAPPPIQWPTPSPGGGGDMSITAQEYGPLTDLQRRYVGALDEFDPETDRGAIRLAQDIRDLASGQRSERLASYARRGLRGPGQGDVSDLLERQSADETTRAAGRAMVDYRAARAGQKLAAIRGGVPVAGAPAELALREKEFSRQIREGEANRQMAQANQTLNAYLSMLYANRSSPIYDVPTAPLVPGGGGGTTIGVVSSIGNLVRPLGVGLGPRIGL